jgi:threonine dehydrogenase-like Zn-dependent dehydrogenase
VKEIALERGGDMKAAFFDGLKSIVVREVDKPASREAYVVIEMKRCGICGSDLHAFLGLWEQPSYASGHEASGTIVECGPAVKGFKIGDRVCMEWFEHCDQCRYCKTGDYNLCDNLQCTAGGNHAGFAEYIAAHTSSLFRIPDGLSFEDAAMVEPLAASCRAFRRSTAGPQDSVFVVGCGTIGQS